MARDSYPFLHLFFHEGLEDVEDSVKRRWGVDVVQCLGAHWVPVLNTKFMLNLYFDNVNSIHIYKYNNTSDLV